MRTTVEQYGTIKKAQVAKFEEYLNSNGPNFEVAKTQCQNSIKILAELNFENFKGVP